MARTRLPLRSGIWWQSVVVSPAGVGNWAVFKVMGIVMKKLVLAAALLAVSAGSSFAADMPMKAPPAPAPAPFDPWDVAFGAGVMNDYIFRGVTQSNHNASVTAYFEPRYNVNK